MGLGASELERLVGEEVAGYRLLSVLGSGASATVFRAENLLTPTIVRALKVMRPELSSSPEFLKRFRDESRILNELVHENIVRFYGAQLDRSHGVLAMDLELLEGRPLSVRLRDGGVVPESEAVSWFVQVARGVEAAHRRGVVHRDLKPENLFLTRGGVVKVLDFGIARAVEDSERTSRLTMEGHVAGTAAYLAPELWRGDEATPRSDVYALGLVLAEVLLGRHPFVGRDGKWPTGPQVMYRHIEGTLPALREERPELSASVESLCHRAMARVPSARPGDAGELLAALEAVSAPRAVAKVAVAASRPVALNTEFGVPVLGAEGAKPKAEPSGPAVAAAPARPSPPAVASAVETGFVAPRFDSGASVRGGAAPGSAPARPSPPAAASAVETGFAAPSLVRPGAPAARLVAAPAEEDEASARPGRRGVGVWLGLGAVVAGLGVWAAVGSGGDGSSSAPVSPPVSPSVAASSPSPAAAEPTPAVVGAAEAAPAPAPAPVLEPCPPGQSRSADSGEHCCWPGQGWSSSRGQCVGAPTSCPEGEEVKGEACAPKPERPDAGPANLDWVVIAPGSFEMGSTSGEEDEKPVHRVTLSGYALARTETTVAQYKACVDAKGCEVPRCGTWGKAGMEQHPVNCVSWTQAAAFCVWAGARLPTEAEWEYGARGPEGRKYPWGETSPASAGAPVCNWEGRKDGFAATAPVGSFPAGRSPAGLDDMAGNVWEWVADWYGPYQAAEATDPTGPATGSKRVYRGGSFVSFSVSYLRGAYRYHVAPSYAYDILGFRCARSFP